MRREGAGRPEVLVPAVTDDPLVLGVFREGLRFSDDVCVAGEVEEIHFVQRHADVEQVGCESISLGSTKMRYSG